MKYTETLQFLLCKTFENGKHMFEKKGNNKDLIKLEEPES